MPAYDVGVHAAIGHNPAWSDIRRSRRRQNRHFLVPPTAGPIWQRGQALVTATDTVEISPDRCASSCQHPSVGRLKNVPHSGPGRSQFELTWLVGPDVGPTISSSGPIARTSKSPEPAILQTTFTSWPAVQGGTSQSSAHASAPWPRVSGNPAPDSLVVVAQLAALAVSSPLSEQPLTASTAETTETTATLKAMRSFTGFDDSADAPTVSLSEPEGTAPERWVEG